jgi:chitodextrinase
MSSGNRTLARQLCRAVFVACVLIAICLLTPALSSAAQVTLAWDANTDPNITGYKLYYGTSSRSYQFSVDVGKLTNYVVTGLQQGVTYYFAATDYNVSGYESSFSNEVSTAIANVTPPTVSMTAPTSGATVSGMVTVSASASDNVGVAGVQFKLDGANLGAELTTAPYTIPWATTLTLNGTRTLTAVARDAAGNTATSTAVSVTVSNAVPDTTPPSVPTNLSASAVSSAQMNLSWTASTDNVGVSGYTIYRGASQIATTSLTSYSDTGLSPSTAYTYTVAAYDAAGNVSALSAAASATTLPPPPADIASGLGLYYKFDEGSGSLATDSSGTGNTGSLLGGTTWTAGQLSQALSFDGVSGNVTAATTTGLNLSTTLTIAAWINPSDVSAPYRTLVAKGTFSPRGYGVNLLNGHLNFIKVGLADVTSSVLLAPGTWQHVAITWNAATSEVKFYLNGALAQTILNSVVPPAPLDTDKLLVGLWLNGGSYFAGAMDELRIYNRVLSATDIVALSTIAAPAPTPTPDTTPPTVSMTAPAASSTVAGTVTISASATDNVGVVGVQFKLDGANLGAEVIAAPYTTSWNTTVAAAGAHTLTALARDAAGNTATAAAVSVTVADTTPPTVSMTAPAASSTVAGTVTISASATDNVGVVGVQFMLDGATLGAEVTAAPYAISWNTITATNGAHGLTAVARDAAGNTATSAVVNTTVSNTADTSSSLGLYYNFDEGSGRIANDSSGIGNAGRLLGGTTWTAGKLGQALSFDGVSGNVTAATTTGLNLSTTLTIAAWINPSDVTAYRTLVAKGTFGPRGYGVNLLNGHLNFIKVGLADVTSSVLLAPGTWQHVAITWNAATSEVKFYLNGALAQTIIDSVVPPAPLDTDKLLVGRWLGGGSYFAGAMDEIRIYNRVLSAADISALYALPTPDTTPPTVSMTAPASGATVAGAITVSASATDNVGVVGVQFKLDGMNLGAEVTTAPYAVSWITGTVANGAHSVTAVARDAAGNTTTAAVVTVTVANDTTPPAVSITAPTAGVSVAGLTTVSASATDNVGVVGVQFKLDGVNLGAEVTTAPYALSWNTTTATNGAHTVTAVARDAAGNTATAAAVSVTVFNDTTPPTVSMTAPAAGATVAGAITVSASATDNVGVVGVQFKLDGMNLGAEVTTAPYAVSWNTTTATNGPHTVTAVARDAAVNSTTSAGVSIQVSNFAPPGTESPYSGAPAPVPGVLEAENFDLGGQGVAYYDLTPGNQGGLYRTTEDVDIIASCDPAGGGYVVNNFQTGEWMNYTITVTQTGMYRLLARVSSMFTGTAYHVEIDGVNVTGSVTVPNTGGGCSFQDAEVVGGVSLSAGQHVLRIQSDVQYFNLNSITITAQPTVSITTPLNGTTLTNLTQVTVQATSGLGLSSIQVYGDSTLIGTVSCATTNPCLDTTNSVDWHTNGLATGPHSLYAVATDAFGNSTSSNPITVNK